MPRRNQSGRTGPGYGKGRRWENFPQQHSFFSNAVPNPDVNVGKRLHELRVEHDLSIRSLAEMSGLAVNTLSLIENGKTSPSVSTLQQLAVALNVPITAFFEADQERKQLIHTRATERPAAQVEDTHIEDLGAGLYNWVVQPLVVTLEAGANSGTGLIVHTGHEFVYCLEGRVLYMVDGKSYLLEAEDSLIFESHLPHRWENVDTTPSKMVLVLFPSDIRDKPAERHFAAE